MPKECECSCWTPACNDKSNPQIVNCATFMIKDSDAYACMKFYPHAFDGGAGRTGHNRNFGRPRGSSSAGENNLTQPPGK